MARLLRASDASAMPVDANNRLSGDVTINVLGA
jgi:hypothetical protein